MNTRTSGLRSFLRVAVILTLLASGVLSAHAEAPPMHAWGQVRLNGSLVGEGMQVMAHLVRPDPADGWQLVKTYPEMPGPPDYPGLTDAQGNYELDIPSTLVQPGDKVEFSVLGIRALIRLEGEPLGTGRGRVDWESGSQHWHLDIEKAHLEADIAFPTGVETFSTEQGFDVTARVENTGWEAATSVTATISISPPGSAQVSPLEEEKYLGRIGADGALTATWRVTCTASGPAEITVTPDGLTPGGPDCDAMPIPEDNLVSDTVIITQELKAHLGADVTAPEVVMVGTTFLVSATISNTGEADALGVIGTIEMTGTAELAEGETITKEIGLIEGGTTSGEIGWTLACTETGDVTITVTPTGTDENTGEPVLPANIISDSITIRQQGVFFLYIPFVTRNWSRPA